MSQLVHRRHKFPERCNADEIVMRETTGIDEQLASLRAEASGDRSSIYQELVRISIVEVDGKKVQQPFTVLESWNSRTRGYVQKLYEHLNDMPEKEVKSFLGAGEDATPGVSAPLQKEQENGPVHSVDIGK